jgi:hypothetical protein
MIKPTGPKKMGTIEVPEITATPVQKTENEVTADYVGKIHIMGIEIGCAVLSDEKRVFFQREVVGALTGNKKGGLERYLKAENLRPFVPDKFAGETWDENVIKFRYGPGITHGFEATDLIDICNMYIQARNAGVLLPSQSRLAMQADIIVNAFAKTGVIAVIDEATGFQTHRKKDALRLLIESYINEEARQWMKEFPDEFFVELDRIYDRKTTSPNKRPQHYGNFINRYIYEPIERGYVLEELQALNPRNDKGNRSKRLHQFLNEQKGIQILRNRIGKVTALLQVSANKRKFDDLFGRMEGKTRQLELWDGDD